MKINALIVDDELNSREVLKTLLTTFCEDVNIIGDASNIQIAHDLIISTKPDLVFLDIQMPLGDGFTLLKKFNPIPFSIIFITSFNHFAINAIKFSALDYLLKPVDVQELIAAVTKAIATKTEVNRYVINLLDNIDEDNQDKKIPFHVQGKVKFIQTSSISHVEADRTYTNVFCEGEKLASAKSLKDFEEFMSYNPNFIRINKSVIINVKYLKEYSKGDPFMITLNSGHVFESSRRKKTEVLKRIHSI